MFAELWDILFFQTWRVHSSDANPSLEMLIYGFNLFEGIAWIVFAALVAIRYHKHKHSSLELLYSFAFLTFAASDFREAWVLTSGLIWWKLINLLVLLKLRHVVMTQYYPKARVF